MNHPRGNAGSCAFAGGASVGQPPTGIARGRE